jgi:hypothetical protein
METSFGRAGAHFFEHIPPTGYLRPNAPETPEMPAQDPSQTVSQWAETALGFQPSATQKQVLDNDAKYLILCCNRQWGKTTTIAIKALYRAIHHADQSIVIISRTKLQAGILIERACNFALRLGYKLRRALGQRNSLKLPNGSSIFAVAHSQDTSAGNTANVLVIDEAALVRDTVYSSVSSFLARTHGATWLLSTPRRQAGFFYNIWHSKDTRWSRVLSTVKDCPEIDPDLLEILRETDPIKYRQDFLCEFIQPAGHLVSVDILDAMVDPTLDPWQVPQIQPR